MVVWEFCPRRGVEIGVERPAGRTEKPPATLWLAALPVGWALRAHALRVRPQSVAVGIRSATWPAASGANEMLLGRYVEAASWGVAEVNADRASAWARSAHPTLAGAGAEAEAGESLPVTTTHAESRTHTTRAGWRRRASDRWR